MPRFWRVRSQGATTPTFKLSRDFRTMHLPPSFIILCLLIRKLCWQTNRCRWKHPMLFTTLWCWIKNTASLVSNDRVLASPTHTQKCSLFLFWANPWPTVGTFEDCSNLWNTSTVSPIIVQTARTARQTYLTYFHAANSGPQASYVHRAVPNVSVGGAHSVLYGVQHQYHPGKFFESEMFVGILWCI